MKKKILGTVIAIIILMIAFISYNYFTNEAPVMGVTDLEISKDAEITPSMIIQDSVQGLSDDNTETKNLKIKVLTDKGVPLEENDTISTEGKKNMSFIIIVEDKFGKETSATMNVNIN